MARLVRNGVILLALALEIVGPDHPFSGNARANLGFALSDQGRWAEALYRRAGTIGSTRLPPAHANAMAGAEKHAGFLIRRNRPDEALGLVRAELGDLLGQDGRGRDWRTRVRGARPLFARQVEAGWALAAATP